MYFHILSMIASKWVLCKRFFTICRRFEEYQRVTNLKAMAASEEAEKAANSSKFPKYGWKVKLNHEFPERRDQNLQPSPTQMVQLLPLGLR